MLKIEKLPKKKQNYKIAKLERQSYEKKKIYCSENNCGKTGIMKEIGIKRKVTKSTKTGKKEIST